MYSVTSVTQLWSYPAFASTFSIPRHRRVRRSSRPRLVATECARYMPPNDPEPGLVIPFDRDAAGRDDLLDEMRHRRRARVARLRADERPAQRQSEVLRPVLGERPLFGAHRLGIQEHPH